jgi:hypothetical protein
LMEEKVRVCKRIWQVRCDLQTNEFSVREWLIESRSKKHKGCFRMSAKRQEGQTGAGQNVQRVLSVEEISTIDEKDSYFFTSKEAAEARSEELNEM